MHRKLKANQVYKILELEGTSPLFDFREDFIGRRIQNEAREDRLVQAKGRGFLTIRGRMLSGKHKGSVLQIIGVRLRQVRKQQLCNCEAYNFPHKKGTGLCNL